MKQAITAFFLALALGGCAANSTPPAAVDTTAEKPSVKYASDATLEEGKGVLIQNAVQVTASVIAVDKSDRSISVRDASGKIQKIEILEDVQNFDSIRPGDDVVLEVYTALAMKLARNGEEFEDTAASMVAVGKPGEKPKLVNVDVVDVLAEISKIDREKREVTVTGPMGNSVTLVVPDDVKRFDELKIGEKVNARYVEAFAMSVETVKK